MTASLKRFVEWYLGIPAAGPGEGTSWTVQTGGWFARAPQWLLLMIVVALIVAVVVVYRRDAARLSWQRRWTLVGLRLAVLGLMLVLMFQATLTISRTGLPSVAVLADDSGSMQFQDDYTGTDDARAVQSLVDRSDSPARIELARRLLSGDKTRLLQRLAEKYRVRLYRFDQQAHPLQPEDESDIASLTALTDMLQASGRDTAPAAAARQVLDEFRGAPPAAIIVLTDGISTLGEENRLHRAAPAAQRMGVPFYVVELGSPRAASDLEMRDVRVDEVAIVDESLIFTGELRATGFEGRDVVVELRDATSGERLAASSARVTGSTQSIELTWVPRTAGEFDFAFGIAPLDEETITENNFQTRHVSVRDGRIRVLLVEDLPRYEFRYLKHLLERTDGRSAFVEVFTVLLDADPEWTAVDKSAAALLGRMPGSADEINAYDVIILGDVDPNLLSPTTQRAMRDFVRESGGGLVLMSGPNHNPHRYRGTPLEPLVPAPLDQVTAADFQRLQADGVRVRPTLSGLRGTPLFRFGENSAETSRILSRLPPLYSLLTLREISPGASVLAAEQDGSGRPVIVSQQYGAGRVVLHATDDLWMWRYRAGDEYYGRYWFALMRYLARSSLLGRNRLAELVSSRETYQRGETVEFRLRFFDSRNVPPDRRVTLIVERRNGPSQAVELQPSPQFPDVFTGSLPAITDGSYHAWISRPTFDDAPPATDFRVQSSSRELLVRAVDDVSLRATAQATRGRFYTVGSAYRLPDELPAGRAVAVDPGEPIPLWSRPEVLLLVIGLLTLEWFLRKISRLV